MAWRVTDLPAESDFTLDAVAAIAGADIWIVAPLALEGDEDIREMLDLAAREGIGLERVIVSDA
jgi:hypothetical protein